MYYGSAIIISNNLEGEVVMAIRLSRAAFRSELRSRNLGLLTEDDHKLINDTTLLIAGCGVGSLIAISAARLGFEKFILIDGDRVETSNINRQGYTTRDVGKYKVVALAQRILHINPHAQITKIHQFVDIRNAEKLVKDADIIIDAIDPQAVLAEIAIHRYAQQYHKYVIQPYDAGWGGFIFVFDPKAHSYEKTIGLDPEVPLDEINADEAFEKVAQFLMSQMPEYVQKIGLEIMEGKRKNFPQPVTAVYIIASMSVIAAKRIALGLPIKTMPEFARFDPSEILAPSINSQ
jgi:molybdopterin/thiamine biosynthesis adenylyltransferase